MPPHSRIWRHARRRYPHAPAHPQSLRGISPPFPSGSWRPEDVPGLSVWSVRLGGEHLHCRPDRTATPSPGSPSPAAVPASVLPHVGSRAATHQERVRAVSALALPTSAVMVQLSKAFLLCDSHTIHCL